MATLYILIGIALLILIVVFFIYYSSSKAAAISEAERVQDKALMDQLRAQSAFQRHFKEVVIHGKTCLYNDQEEGVVKFLKIKKGKVRVGYLFVFEEIDFSTQIDWDKSYHTVQGYMKGTKEKPREKYLENITLEEYLRMLQAKSDLSGW